MKLSECTLGLIVKEANATPSRIGHIVGLTYFGDRVLPEVLWAGEKHPRGINQFNISILDKGDGES